MTLKIDWCSPQAAKYACEHWHYSASYPSAGATSVGVWENDLFVGAIIFGYGANNHIGCPYGLTQHEVCELTRVAMRNHSAPISQCVSKAIRMLRGRCPGLRLIVSYADEGHNHKGVIYQAMNWVYVGATTNGASPLVIRGKRLHAKSVHKMCGTHDIEYIKKNIDASVKKVEITSKHKYLYPLDKKMRKKISALQKPYPKVAQIQNTIKTEAV